MKNIYKTVLALFVTTVALAQPNHLFDPTTYRGAMAPAPTAMWTDPWCNWDPQNTAYGAPTITVNANITTNTTWTSNNVYLIQGLIYVKNGATLTIQPGTVIQGDKSIPNSALVICNGAKINAAGTANNPIVFTSNQPAGSRSIGDWGGIILLGTASMNAPGDTGNIEGISPTPDTRFGGGTNPNDNDNSGVMQYVRIEFPGYIFAPNKEINGLTFGAVGRNTTIDHIQVSFSNDDSYEWFGGTVNAKYLVAFRGLDDDFDTDNGFSGHVQFCLGVRDPNIADNPSISTSEGFESDNDANGSTNTPITSAIFSNVTDIGPLRGVPTATVASGFRRGARIRRNSNLKIFNSLLMDHLRGVHIDGTLCEGNATSGALKYAHNINAGNQTGKVCEVNSGSTFNIWGWYGTTNPSGLNDSVISTAGILINPYPADYMTGVDYRPANSSIALGGADFSDPVFNGIVTGLTANAFSEQNITLYPNPAQDKITISYDAPGSNVTVSVWALTGEKLLEEKSAAGNRSLTVNTDKLASGIYFAQINDNHGHIANVKFSIAH